ncbi:MAG: DUF4337 domain-containing protein [Hyphomicrobiaceae bacterium]|nr:DUF4337 domain-containing protein [Hyphomicrobiaceae bacterium]MCC0007160.1 DUF4337 domain-containing protein [Hyphomicrobiaceae bacterium]
MALDDLPGRTDDDGSRRNRDRWIGVYIGVLAVLLAITSMGGDNAAKEATLKNIAASNMWSFFQAKNIRRQLLRAHTEDLELLLATTPTLTPEQRQRIEEKIAANKATDARLTSDPESKEGLDELFQRGKALEKERDLAMMQDPYFDYAQACLQIAIVLASIAIISGGLPLLVLSGLLGLAGLLLSFNGFTMLANLPGMN